MRWLWLGIALLGCGPKIANDRPSSDVVKHLPATLEAARPADGDPKSIKIRVYVDPGVRATASWRAEVGDQIDYASQLLVPLSGARLEVESFKDWDRAGDPSTALQALVELDKGDDVTWVIGYVTAGDTASKAMSELGMAEPLGRHLIVRGWAEKAETTALAATLPDMREAERVEVLAAHRRHKQTVVLLHMLATTLGAVHETDTTWIQHPTYSARQSGFSERNRELITLGIAERLIGTTDQNLAKRLLESIEKSAFGGWIATSHEEVTRRLRNVIDAAKSGQTAAAVPTAAYDQYVRIKELARQGKPADALIELDNLLIAYPGNAAMHQLKCEIMLAARDQLGAPAGKPPAKPAPKAKSPGLDAARAACQKASDLAPGDPTPHLAVAAVLAQAEDFQGARDELVLAEAKVGNLKDGAEDAWKKVIAMYRDMGALTWTEQAIAKANLTDDPIAQLVAQKRARYGVPAGAKFVRPEQEAALVAAIRGALDLIYASKYGDAERAIAAGEKRWPGAPGFAAARCDLALRLGQLDGARAACGKALAGDPNDSWALYLSAVLSLKTAAGTRQGIDQLKKAIAVDPELGQAWRTLAKAYQRTKDKAAYEQLAKDYQVRFGQPLPP
jgi:tetratricopeptide (TPR) repeat protein